MEQAKMNLKQAIQIMKNQVKDKYALEYIDGLENVIENDGMHGLVIQMRYIRENIRYWRGEDARKVKEFMDNWILSKRKEEPKEKIKS